MTETFCGILCKCMQNVADCLSYYLMKVADWTVTLIHAAVGGNPFREYYRRFVLRARFKNNIATVVHFFGKSNSSCYFERSASLHKNKRFVLFNPSGN